MSVTWTRHDSGTEVGGHVVRLAVKGEIDLDAESKLLGVVDDILTDASSALVVDLDEVSFIDSSGVRVLVRAYRDYGARVRLGPVSPAAHRVLEIAGVLGLYERADEAGA